jgi:hypothetical protein
VRWCGSSESDYTFGPLGPNPTETYSKLVVRVPSYVIHLYFRQVIPCLRCYPFRRLEYQRLPGRNFWDMGTTPNFSEAFHHFAMTFDHIHCTEYDCQTKPLCLKLQCTIVSQSWRDENTSMPPACVFLVVYLPPNILPRCSKSGKDTSPYSSTKDPCLDTTRTRDDSLWLSAY